MSPLPWSLLALMSLLTKLLTNYFLRAEGWNTENHKTIVPSNNQPPTELTKTFSLDELATGLSLLKPWQATGLDDLLTEVLQNIGNNAKSWLLGMLNECTRTKHIPYIWRKAKLGDSHTKGWEGPHLPKKISSNLAVVHSII